MSAVVVIDLCVTSLLTTASGTRWRRRVVTNVCRRSWLGRRRPKHDLRHTFGTHVAASGQVSIRTLQEWMGHARLSTTEIYADFMPSDNEAALVEAAFAPRS